MIGAPAPGLRLTDAQKLNWLRLLRSDNVGPATFRDVVNGFGSAEAALEALPELARRGGGRRIVLFPRDRAEAELDAIHRHGARLVALGEDGYPEMLRHMDMPPPLVTVRGSGHLFRQPTIAIVGARNASIAGVRMARMIAGELGSEGIAIASGLARGIDTAAHGASLATGTIAVLAGGIGRP